MPCVEQQQPAVQTAAAAAATAAAAVHVGPWLFIHYTGKTLSLLSCFLQFLVPAALS
jgi:hypothetical protein